MQNRYSLLFNEIVMKQNRPDANPLYGEQHRRQEERMRTEVSQTQNQNAYLRAQTQGVKNRIDDLQRRLQQMKEEGGSAQARMAKDIQDAKSRLEQADRDYAEVTNLKTSLEKEIGVYRDLLESKRNQPREEKEHRLIVVFFSSQVKVVFVAMSIELFNMPNNKYWIDLLFVPVVDRARAFNER